MPPFSRDDIRWLPRPRSVRRRPGHLTLPAPAVVELSAAAQELAPIIGREWPPDAGTVRTIRCDEPGFLFRLRARKTSRVTVPRVPDRPECYGLSIGRGGIAAASSDYRGLLYAWQILRQILREKPGSLPLMTISDSPDIPWRVYHLDLKGTRRTPENLFLLAERLAEFRINALLVEYEDYLRLERHPELAVESALDGQTVREWIAYLENYGIAVIPLVQTLGHWQYVLTKPEYVHLRELPDATTDGCPLHPGTWDLVRDFLDEIIALHPRSPLIHIGLDETALLGKCPRCQAHLDGRPPIALHIEWLNRVASYVRSRGYTPMAWCDKLLSEVDGPHEDELRKVDPSIVFLSWDYQAGGPTAPGLMLHHRHYVSRQWLQRPDRIVESWPRLGFGPKSDLIENLPADAYARAQARFAEPEDPRRIRNFAETARLREMGFEMFGAAGLRVSYHGSLAPRFMTAQFNAMAWADAARKLGLAGVIGTSWSRGHSWAATNAHPELDWYAIASLGEACWSGLAPRELPDFDRRFAFQFFGLPDGNIGDAFGLFHRSATRADHVMDNFSVWIDRLLADLRPSVTRNADVFDLLHAMAALQTLQLELDFSLLEGAYFTALWSRVPPAFKASMHDGILRRLATAEARCAELKSRYRQTMAAADADELAETQLRFPIHQVTDLLHRFFPDTNNEENP